LHAPKEEAAIPRLRLVKLIATRRRPLQSSPQKRKPVLCSDSGRIQPSHDGIFPFLLKWRRLLAPTFAGMA
jgi:hypothetical protein